MSIRWAVFFFAGLAGIHACAENRQADPCQDVTCNQPPPNKCKNGTTLLEYTGLGACDPGTGQCIFEATEKICDQFCENGLCDVDLGNDFALLARSNVGLCTLSVSPDVFANYATKGILYFKEGLWRLPRDQATFESDLVDRVELTPGGSDLQPTGPGVFTRTPLVPPDDGWYLYEYHRPYDLGGGAFDLAFRAAFEVRAGQAVEPLRVIDDEQAIIATCDTTISAWGASLDWNNAFITCRLDVRELFERWRVEVTVENGDRITFHLRLGYKCCCFIGRDWADLVETSFVRGQQERSVTDFYRQAFSAQHHIFGQSLLAMLDTPVDNVHGILLVDADTATPTLQYLDAGMRVIDTPAITNLETIQE